MKYLGFVMPMILLATHVFSQGVTLSGKIYDENTKGLPGAIIQLSPGNRHTTSDTKGTFMFQNLPPGDFNLTVSYIGFSTINKPLTIGHHDLETKIELTPQADLLDEVVIKDNYALREKQESSYNTEVVTENFIKRNLGGSLMQSLERLPGISSIDIGAGQSKPVIRGLSFNRVVVAENGIKHEGQQWGADHGLEIDQFAAHQVEIIKGAASLMYGADAIGGVIDIRNYHIPEKHTLAANLDLTAKSNNKLAGFSANMSGRTNTIYFDARGTYLNYADFSVPTDVINIYNYPVNLHNHQLRNTAGREADFHLTTGYISDHFNNSLYLSSVYNKAGFFANAHGLEPRKLTSALYDKNDRDILQPFQEVHHLKAINRSVYIFGEHKAVLELGYQNNFRQEWSDYVSHGYMPPVFPDTLGMNAALERQFNKNIYSANGHVLLSKQNHTVTAGFNLEMQQNQIGGYSFIIPHFQQQSAGLYLLDKIKLNSHWWLNAGVRFDAGRIKTETYRDWFTTPVITGNDTNNVYLMRSSALNRQFNNLSWALGINYNGAMLSAKANLAKSFRMPTPQELASNGINYHHFSFEKGDSTLHAEESYQLDLSIEITFPYWAIQISPFINYFPNYIYLNPTSRHDYLYGAGNQVYEYRESEVLRSGGELHVHVHPLRWLKAGLIGEYVYSNQLTGEKKHYTLPFSPPAQLLFNLSWLPNIGGRLSNSYLSVDYIIAAAQNRIVPPEQITPGYQVINLSAGTFLKWNNQQLNINLQVRNLLNAYYFNHTSYYRIIDIPEPGINFILNMSIPLSIISNE